MRFVKIIGLVLIVLFTLVIPTVSAETPEKVDIYMFWGNGCPHCESAKIFFKDLEKDYPEYLELHSYEVWSDTENSALIAEIDEKLAFKVVGVPIIKRDKKSYNFQSSLYFFHRTILSKVISSQRNVELIIDYYIEMNGDDEQFKKLLDK